MIGVPYAISAISYRSRGNNDPDGEKRNVYAKDRINAGYEPSEKKGREEGGQYAEPKTEKIKKPARNGCIKIMSEELGADNADRKKSENSPYQVAQSRRLDREEFQK